MVVIDYDAWTVDVQLQLEHQGKKEKGMRFAVISDIHGNEPALKAVIEDIEQWDVDEIICLGDVATLGPAPGKVIHMLQELNCRCIMGNHDAFMLDPGLVRSYTSNQTVVDAVNWCRDQLTDPELNFLASFKDQILISPDASSQLLCFHGTPGDHSTGLVATTPEDRLDRMLAGSTADVMACGHTHIQMLRQHMGVLIVNPGSVGAPFHEHTPHGTPIILEHAEYAVIEMSPGHTDVKLRRISYNRKAFWKAVEESDEPVKHLFSIN